MLTIIFGMAGWLKSDIYTRWPFLALSGTVFGVGFGFCARILIVVRRRAREHEPVTNDWPAVACVFLAVILAAACAGLA